jgi:hypothetical protein
MDWEKNRGSATLKVRKREKELIECLRQGIQRCRANDIALPGIQEPLAEEVFLGQLVDSIRRVKYVPTIAVRNIHPNRGNGNSAMFDPLKAAILMLRHAQMDEASWLVFLFVHFGLHPKAGWRYARETYGALGHDQGWTWACVSADPESFRNWLRNNESVLKRG